VCKYQLSTCVTDILVVEAVCLPRANEADLYPKILHQSQPHTCVSWFCAQLPSGQLPAGVDETHSSLLLLLLSTPSSVDTKSRAVPLRGVKLTKMCLQCRIPKTVAKFHAELHSEI